MRFLEGHFRVVECSVLRERDGQYKFSGKPIKVDAKINYNFFFQWWKKPSFFVFLFSFGVKISSQVGDQRSLLIEKQAFALAPNLGKIINNKKLKEYKSIPELVLCSSQTAQGFLPSLWNFLVIEVWIHFMFYFYWHKPVSDTTFSLAGLCNVVIDWARAKSMKV